MANITYDEVIVMTIDEILEQAKILTEQEREELVVRLMKMREETILTDQNPKTGAEIVLMLNALNAPIEFVNPEITDPVEWIKAQRQKQHNRLYGEG